MGGAGVIEQILQLARWAPSGDNTQCWQFEIVDPAHLVVHGFDTREHCVYDLDGHPSQISYGALLETIAIAASAHGLRAEIARRPGCPEERPLFDVRLVADPAITPSPLLDAIEVRSVQRRPMRMRPLSAAEKQEMAAAVGPQFEIAWFESLPQRLRVARLMFDNAKLRLIMPEAYEVHRKIIDWGQRTSAHGVPDQALGVDRLTLRLMKWAMASWGRMSAMNTLMGTWAPRLQMDLVPGIACAGHFVLRARRKPDTIDDWVAAGRAVQRLWLTMTRLGLWMQPEMTPLIFSRYVGQGRRFSRLDRLHARAERLRRQAAPFIDAPERFPVYMGRVGAGPAPRARSVRKEVAALMKR